MEVEKNYWWYTVVIYLIISGIVLLLILPFIYITPQNILYVYLMILLTGFLVALFSAYILTPMAFWRKYKPLPILPLELENRVNEMINKSGIKKPKFFEYDSPELNAFTYSSIFGPRIILTTGLINSYNTGKISLDELSAIIGHEMGHIRHKDSLRGAIALSWVSIINGFGTYFIFIGFMFLGIGTLETFFSRDEENAFLTIVIGIVSIVVGFIMKIIAKLISLISLHHSRIMEYQADAYGAYLTSNVYMADALKKIENYNNSLIAKNLGYAPYPEGWQVPPVKQTWIDKLFSTHPPTEKRIERLIGKNQ
ncbi:MAG: M48 family metallopeptidase [Thermoplasmata archaeon]